MAARTSSGKRGAIDKDQARIVIIVAVSSAIVVFSLVATRVFVSKMLHQNRVISAKTEARDQLETNLEELGKLESSYRTFEDAPESILRTNESNSKIILDALPSKYDYVGLLSSMETIISPYNILELSGDDLVLESALTSTEPEVIEIPLKVGIETSYEGAQKYLNDLDRSIRPFNVRHLQITANEGTLNVVTDLVTYYQPEKKLDISEKEIN